MLTWAEIYSLNTDDLYTTLESLDHMARDIEKYGFTLEDEGEEVMSDPSGTLEDQANEDLEEKGDEGSVTKDGGAQSGDITRTPEEEALVKYLEQLEKVGDLRTRRKTVSMENIVHIAKSIRDEL